MTERKAIPAKLLQRIKTVTNKRARFVLGVGEQERAEAAREVDDDIDAARAHAIDDFLEQSRIAAALARFGVADVDVNDARSGLGGLDAGGGDLRRRHGHGRMPRIKGRVAGDGAGDDDFAIAHEFHPFAPVQGASL